MQNNLRQQRLNYEAMEFKKASIEFRKKIDKMYLDKYPETNFCLDTDNLEVKAAYQKLTEGKSIILDK